MMNCRPRYLICFRTIRVVSLTGLSLFPSRHRHHSLFRSWWARTLIKSSHGSRWEKFGLVARSRATSIAGVLREERATKPPGQRTPALGVAYFLAFHFVARWSVCQRDSAGSSSEGIFAPAPQGQTAAGILPPRASWKAKK